MYCVICHNALVVWCCQGRKIKFDANLHMTPAMFVLNSFPRWVVFFIKHTTIKLSVCPCQYQTFIKNLFDNKSTSPPRAT